MSIRLASVCKTDGCWGLGIDQIGDPNPQVIDAITTTDREMLEGLGDDLNRFATKQNDCPQYCPQSFHVDKKQTEHAQPIVTIVLQ